MAAAFVIGIPAALFSSYSRSLHEQPLVTKCITAGILQILSEYLACSLRRYRISYRRLRLLALYGLLFSGPLPHFWQLALEYNLSPLQLPLLMGALLRVLLDQLSYGPIMNSSFVVFLALCVEESKTKGAKRQRVTRSELWMRVQKAQMNAWRVFPIAAFISYAVIPVDGRPVFMNLVALSWTTFIIATTSLSRRTRRSGKERDDDGRGGSLWSTRREKIKV